MKLRILDATQKTQIVPDVLMMDTAYEPMSVIANNLNDILNNGIWLNPFRSIPKVERIPDLDVVYVDSFFRVLRCFESYTQHSMISPDETASSALVLPSGRVRDARIGPGDSLEFRDVATGNLLGGYAASRDAAPSRKGTVEPIDDDLQFQLQPRAKWLRRVLGRLVAPKEQPKAADRRKAERHAMPGLSAYFTLTRLRRRFPVDSISTEGFHVLTEERWPVGTSMMVGLQIINPVSYQVEATISVQSEVIRVDSDGVGFAFDDDPAHRNRHLTVTSIEEWQQLEKFLRIIKNGS